MSATSRRRQDSHRRLTWAAWLAVGVLALVATRWSWPESRWAQLRDACSVSAPAAHTKDDSATRSGMVQLDHDVLVREGRAVDVRGGARADTSSTATRSIAPEYELIVSGTLLVGGSRGAKFPSGEEAAAEWEARAE